MDPNAGIEERLIDEYLQRCSDERLVGRCSRERSDQPTLLLTEGFEDRSLGLLRRLASTRVELPAIVLARYVDDGGVNNRLRADFERLAEQVAPGRWHVVDNHNDGKWVAAAERLVSNENIIIDISGLSNRGLFGALDGLLAWGWKAHIAYTEAREYWPRRSEWADLRRRSRDPAGLADILDTMPWLFGHQHRIERIAGHEGYDAAGAGRALIAFLPFKCARLAAVLGEEDYSDIRFISGKPRLKKNLWRADALRQINFTITKDWPVVEMPTFGYRQAIQSLAQHLFAGNSPMARYDVHLAVMGSKLQNVACWALSRLVPSLTVLCSVPVQYFPEAFSGGVGQSWLFPLSPPRM